MIFIISGCSSLSTWVRSNLEGVPVWVYEPQVSRDQSAFVGRGTAPNETRARILAFESVLTQLSDAIGEDVVGKHITELSNRSAIEEYRLRITQQFIKVEETGVTVFFLAIADEEVLQQARTDAEIQLFEQQQQMQRLEQEAAEAFRETRDVIAAEKYLQMAYIANSLPVDRGKQQYEDAINRVRRILEALHLSVSDGNPAIPTTIVTLRRGSRTFSPRVLAAPVLAYSIARDGLGNSYEDSQRFVTNETGQFTFSANNPSLIGRGFLHFIIDLDKALAPLEEIDGSAFTEFKQIIEGKRVQYPYSRVPVIGGQPLLVAISEYSFQGNQLGSNYAGQALAEELAKDGIRLQLEKAVQPEDDDNLIELLQSTYPSSSAIIYGNVGISQIKETAMGVAVTVTGSNTFVDLRTATVRGDSGRVAANAIAPTFEEAQKEAFTRYGYLSASLLFRFLYQ